MPKHVFFDLDGTLTRSHYIIDPSHIAPLQRLCRIKDVIVVTGGTYPDIRRQLTEALDHQYFSLAQSGGHALSKSGDELWRVEVNAEQTHLVLDLIEKLKRGFGLAVRDEHDCVQLRGSQISYSTLGYNEDVNKKEAFDPDFSRRKAMLARFPEEVQSLRAAGIEIAVAGTTTFNFTIIGQDKGSNVERLIERERWNKDACVYVGDALKPGENDFAVVGVIETHAVKSPVETFEFIKKMIS